MEPITTAALIAGLVQIGKTALGKASEKIGDQAVTTAMQYWPKVKSLLGFTTDPAPEKLDDEIGKAVYGKPEIHQQLRELLNHEKQAATLVGSMHVNKGIVTVIDTNTGPFNLTMNMDKD